MEVVNMKVYEKPSLEVYDLTSEERLANSSNCAAKTGNEKSAGNPCPTPDLWSHHNPTP